MTTHQATDHAEIRDAVQPTPARMSIRPSSETLPDLLREITGRFGDREALVDACQRCTYSEFHVQVQDFAAGLHAFGIRPGDKVALLMGNRVEWVVAAFAVASLGAVVVAINTWWTAREVAYALDHSGSVMVVATGRYIRKDYGQMLEELRANGRVPALRQVIGVGAGVPASWTRWEEVVAIGRAAGDVQGPVQATADSVAFMLYTSGSTSKPKGVQLVHRSLIHNVWNIGERQKVTEQDRLWLAVSLFWGFGCSNAMMNLITHGGCIVLQDAFDAGEALRLIEQERCTLIYGTPNMIQALHEHPERPARDLSCLRGGATLGTPEQIRRAVELGARDICNVYGLTEIYGNCHVTDADAALDLRTRSCGKPLPGVQQRIVDPVTGEDLPPGQTGEIRVKGHVMAGYFRNGEQTALAFDEQGFFRTGDLGYVDEEGHLFFRGRMKELIKSGGINVAPAEIEEVLLGHPAVQLCYVTGVPDPKRDYILGAIIVKRAGMDVTEQELRDYCRREMAAYKVPSLYRFVHESELPLTTTGKVHKDRLANDFFAAVAQAA